MSPEPAPATRPALVFDPRDGLAVWWKEQAMEWAAARIDYREAGGAGEDGEPAPRGGVAVEWPDGQTERGAGALAKLHRWVIEEQELEPTPPSGRARLRAKWLSLTAYLGGKRRLPSSWFVTRWVFVRLLGIVYLTAFLSWWLQCHGLVGSEGIVPADDYLGAFKESFGTRAYWLQPTVFWFWGGDVAMHMVCGAGVVLAGLVVFGVLTSPCLLALWVLYLSLAISGNVFMSYQWDSLLIEAGFLGVLAGTWRFRLRIDKAVAFPLLPRLAVWLLLARLMFLSGIVKLGSQDPTWASGTALDFHFETQPLPTWVGWYAHQLPGWVKWASVKAMFAIELAFPFFVFGPRRLRVLACAGFVLLNLAILLTGNYAFFNFLTIILCLALLDDTFWPRFLRRRLGVGPGLPRQSAGGRAMAGFRHFASGAIAAVLMAAGIFSAVLFLQPRDAPPRKELPAWSLRVSNLLATFRTVNNYGLFAKMTTERPEIVIEGSRDGMEWVPYEFRWKPGDPKRRPRFVAPHQPRLDWQMWFAALERHYNPHRNPWFGQFILRLFENSPRIIPLLETNPFADEPPRFIRATLYQYEMTTPEERRGTGNWWKRKPVGIYFPATERKDSDVRD